MKVKSGEIEMVDDFTYLGSVLSSEEVMNDVKSIIAKAARAFGSLKPAVFSSSLLSLSVKRAVYQAVVVSVLMYGAETWTLKAEHIRQLTIFHNRCVRTILGVTRFKQWQQRMTSRMLSERFGMSWSLYGDGQEVAVVWSF